MNLRAGTLDDTSWLVPVAHMFLRSAQGWVQPAPGAECHEIGRAIFARWPKNGARCGRSSFRLCGDVSIARHRSYRAGSAVTRQLFLAPSLIQARIASRSHFDSCFLLCGMRSCGEARQSISSIRLLDAASPGMTILPNLVPFMTPS